MAQQYGGYSQHRDTGVRHSNPKPQPSKKASRVPGEGRGEWSQTVWNRRRKFKGRDKDFCDEFIEQAYGNMPTKMYRHNLNVNKRYQDSGCRWNMFQISREFVNPARHMQEIAPKKYLCKRQALGSQPAKKSKSQIKTACAGSTKQRSTTTQPAKKLDEHTISESHEKEPGNLPMDDEDERLVEPSSEEYFEQQQDSEVEFDWDEIESQTDPVYQILGPLNNDEEEYVVI